MKNYISISKKIKNFKRIIKIDGDKSISIRSLIFASLATGKSKIQNLLESEDVINTIKCLKKLGVNIKKKERTYLVNGAGINKYKFRENLTLDAGNSGTLARLLFSTLVSSPYKIKLIGDQSLSKRDFARIINPLSDLGAKFFPKNRKKLPLMIQNCRKNKKNKFYELKGSAQVKSAIMIAGLQFKTITEIIAKESRNHTENFFKFLKIPIKIKKTKSFDKIKIKGIDKFNSFNYTIPSDISSSLFFLALTILTKKSEITIKNVNINSTRTGAIKILSKMGIKFRFKNIKNYKGEKISDIFVKSPKEINSINCPKTFNSSAIDEFLIIFLIAAKAKGTSYFKDLGELNHKESPRLTIGSKFLTMIGVKNYCFNNNIKIIGNPKLKLNGNFVMKDFMKDHRVFMMSTIAALTLGGNWKIYDPQSAKTSFPAFLKLVKKLGGKFV